ncbi:hypothetical protein H2198_009477 [Neophaeococcomyces mojaviensis]|uniref:Uncharacterized protein n=1 Tax=Neophaeococcomyces mojaviensis TaxID=3383035 RepID=A0ACC2ZUD8_9EURO|nr:hypothetical protein H2198_009477 [Knufia sp. JES_112]
MTDHDSNGKAIIGSDMVLEPANPLDPSGKPPTGIIPGFTSIFRTTKHPADAQGPWADPHGGMQDLVGKEGVVCRIVDFPPIPADHPDDVNFMHRTISVDYGVVLKGEIELVLDDGVKTLMKEGDVVVQRGTIHHWNNVSGQNCRVFFVLVPAEPVKVEKTGELLPATDTTHLEKPKDGA